MISKYLIKLVLILLLAVPVTGQASDGSGTQADHEQLRGLLGMLRDSINSRDLKSIEPYLHQPFSATMITQDMVSSSKELKEYFDKWMSGESALVKSLTISPEADALTEIYDGKYGIVRGTNNEQYELATGNNYTIQSRWTATVIKDDGQWKLLAVHSGVNFVDNPVLEAVADEATTLGLIGGVVGLVIGFLAAWLLRRKKTA